MKKYISVLDKKLCSKLHTILSLSLSPSATGAAFAMLQNNKIIAKCAHGVGVDDLFCIGSISKVYCAAAIMKLVDQGLVELDLPVCEYLPRFKMRDSRYRNITVRMLLNHSSGLPGTCVKSGFTREPLSQKAMEDCYYEYFKNSVLKADPGAYSVYCNDGSTVAELIIKEVSGMHLSEFVREKLTEPIGAFSTCYTHDLTDSPKVVMGDKPEIIMLSGAGGVMTSMADLCRFGAVFLNEGDNILSSNSIEEMCKSNGKSQIVDPAALNYGLGWDTVCGRTANVHFAANQNGLSIANHEYAIGDGVCVKSGTTTQVKSIIYVIPEHNAVCAMAVTHDCGISRDVMLPLLYAECLKHLGQEIRKPLPKSNLLCLPADNSFSGYYLSGPDLLKCEIEQGVLSLYACVGEKRIPMAVGLSHSGGDIFSFKGQPYCKLVHGKDRDYMYVILESFGLCCVAEKIPVLKPISDKWKKRCGKAWICVNAAASDMAIEGDGAIARILISKELPNTLLFKASSPDSHGVVLTPFTIEDQDNGRMLLNGPSMSSRDGCCPRVFMKDGLEYLNCTGRVFLNTEYLSDVEEGRYSILDNEKNIALRIPTKGNLQITAPSVSRVLYFDIDYKRVYSPVPGGVLLLVGNVGDVFSVSFK